MLENKKKITWVTPDYFVDCDFDPDLFSGILESFDIHWIVLLPGKNARFSENDFDAISKLPGLQIEFIYWTCRERSPKMLLFYEAIYRRIKQLNADLVYFNYVPTNPYLLPLYWRLNKRKTVFTAHDGSVKPSFKMPFLSKIVFTLGYDTTRYVNTFSPTQDLLFRSNFNKAKTFIIPLGLKDFGKSNLPKRADHIIFLFFGSIHSNKNIELLIDAACNLYSRGIRGFKVAIHGSCTDWDIYKSKIRYPELFECDIRLHKNAEIPDLFTRSHYIVFPYKEMSQSGALKVAFNYCVPVIVSDLKGFTDEVENGINGFVFKSDNVNDLERVMTERLKKHPIEYKSLQKNVCDFNGSHYSTGVLTKRYLAMFNQVISNK